MITLKEVTPEEWIEALKSGKYKPANCMLKGYGENEYCCMGVLAHIMGAPESDLLGVRMNWNTKHHLPKWLPMAHVNVFGGLNDRWGQYPITEIEQWNESRRLNTES